MKKTKVFAVILAVAMAFGTLTGCTDSKTIASIGDVKIPTKIFDFMIENYRAQVEQSDSSFQSNPDKWNNYKVNDKYAIDIARENAKQSVTQLAVYLKKAEDDGITLTDKELKNVDSEIAKEVDNMGGEDAFNKAAANLGIDKETYREIRKDSAIMNKVNEKIEKNVKVDDATLKTAFLKDYVGAKHILIKTVDANGNDLSQDKITAASAKAEQILKEIKAGANFDDMIKKYSEDKSGDTVNSEVMVFTTNQMVEEFETAAFKLKVGEISDVVRTQYGYHIIERCDISDASYFTKYKDEVKNTVLEDKLQEEYKKWKADYEKELKLNDKYINKYTFKAKSNATTSTNSNSGSTTTNSNGTSSNSSNATSGTSSANTSSQATTSNSTATSGSTTTDHK